MIPFLLLAAAGQAATPALPPEAQKLTVAQKAAQLVNEAPAEPALNLPAYDWWSEGLHGIARNGPSTVFPQAMGMAATWDPALIQKVGDVVAVEARAKFNAQPLNADRGLYQGLTIWSPNINIFRDPRWGRGQETYGEDPFLTSRIGIAFVRGLQGPDLKHPKVIATVKHMAVHSGPEGGRDSFDVMVSPRDLEATYLPAFRATVTEGKALSLMCAYNAIHGTPVCANPMLLTQRLRTDWGFNGLVVSDCDAVGNIWMFHHAQPDAPAAAAAALRAGTDLNCGKAYLSLPQAVERGLITEGEIDTALARALAVRRMLTVDSLWNRIKASEVGTPAHRALALETARKGIILLDNPNDMLPLKDKKVAVFGADADDLGVLEGNYHGTAINPVTPLDGIRAKFGRDVRYAQGSVLAEGAFVGVPETALSANGEPGLTVEAMGANGQWSVAGQDRRIDFNYTKTAPFQRRWTGTLTPPGPGQYKLRLDGPACWHACPAHDAVKLYIDDQLVVDDVIGGKKLETTIDGSAPRRIRVEIDHKGGDEGLRLQWLPPAEALTAEALKVAGTADVLIAVVGLSPDLEGEALGVSVPGFAGGDRTEVVLPEPQRKLLAALQATGKPVVAVVMSGSAVSLGDFKPAATLAAFYPGTEGGTALAEILAGDVNPSGRLPVTIYHSTADLPAFADYGMKERTYRYFTGKPAWGFGHGLSYTRFDYGQPTITASVAAGQPVDVAVQLRNIGQRAGEEVTQAYLVPPATDEKLVLTDPVLQRQLVGFTRVALKPGQAGTARFTIDPRMMSQVWRDGTRRILPGTYKLYIGGGQPGDGAGQWTQFTVTGQAQDLPK
ncbi:glycoside hydrolase family 3 C-terminal domain-containing protein [Sphingomonas sanguinis]|uniref:Glycoside hydrolase family 3 n=1 Tax=Sphingomonas sanguinis TaxID=33051 RepID=A0A147J9R6_9SPHN|nr:glycoside hydrolase family 3 N-terminal domain-containing protein [Sphingomonas sanguinis]KTW14734.1 glycoside hydrolase family 3 [Sphingomonas sanguinis]